MFIQPRRVAANASRHRVDSGKRLRQERAKIRRQIRHWQQACEATEDHLMVEQRTGQESSDNKLLLPVADGAMERCGEWAEKVSHTLRRTAAIFRHP